MPSSTSTDLSDVINKTWLEGKQAGEAHEDLSSHWCVRGFYILCALTGIKYTQAVTLEGEITAAQTLMQHMHRGKLR